MTAGTMDETMKTKQETIQSRDLENHHAVKKGDGSKKKNERDQLAHRVIDQKSAIYNVKP